MTAENCIILNLCGHEQPLHVPQFASSASRRYQRETEMAPGGRSNYESDRHRLRGRAVCALWVEFGDGLRCIRCVRATMRLVVCGAPHESIGVRRESVRSVDLAVSTAVVWRAESHIAAPCDRVLCSSTGYTIISRFNSLAVV